MRKKICGHPGCNRLIDPGERYCKEHAGEPKREEPFKTAVRANASLYNTTRWRKLRNRKIREHPYCVKCGIDKYLEVHHLTPPRGDGELFFNEENIIVVCETCHRIITNGEIRGRKRR
jgi:5-methylcytosine-specific restriction protein A